MQDLKVFAVKFVLLLMFLEPAGCGYKVLSLKDRLGEKGIKVGSIKNLSKEPGLEEEVIRLLKKSFLSKGIRLLNRSDYADYAIDITIKNVQITPLSYTKGINILYTYEYECRIDVDFEYFSISNKMDKRVFTLSESGIFFSSDQPATTEANKRVAMEGVLSSLIERFLKELALGI
jgi:hypothetical protein